MCDHHPIIALWAHPRSMSTATERIMRERGDCTVFHEAFLADYYLHRGLAHMPMLAEPDTPRDYASVRAMILAAGEDGPVFFKDMSYYVVPRIFEDPDFARRLVNVFLIRDPRRSIASYYKLDPDLTLVEVGIEAQWQHFANLRDELKCYPMVVQAEAIQADPRGVIGAVWQRAGLPFVEKAFIWQADETPEDWKYVEGWHADALASSGIRKDGQNADDVFAKAAAKAPHLSEFLAHHWPFYERLKAAAQP